MPCLQVITARVLKTISYRPDNFDVLGMNAGHGAGVPAEDFEKLEHDAVVNRRKTNVSTLLAAEAHEEFKTGKAEFRNVLATSAICSRVEMMA